MFSLDSNTAYILFIFLLMITLVVYVYDDNINDKYIDSQKYIKKKYIDDDHYKNKYDRDFYIYNQTVIDDLYPTYI